MRIVKQIIAIVLVVLVVISCKKPPGPGGKATIKGKLKYRNFDNYNVSMISEYYAGGENVYICYGNSDVVRNNIKTSYDGSFQFLYLNQGHYKVFVESADTSIHVKNSKKTLPVYFDVDINSTSQTVDLGEIIANKN
jgi:hypothetical protein